MSEVATSIEDNTVEEDIEKLDSATDMLAEEGNMSCIVDVIGRCFLALCASMSRYFLY
jgi:hypothetical protein